MKNYLRQLFFFGGLALVMLAAFPVFAQTNSDNKINRKPLQDFGAKLSDRVEKKEVVITKNFLVEVLGELTEEGKFDLQKTHFVRTEGDEKMLDVAKNAIEAINDSGLFYYFKQLDITKINLLVEQNDERIYMLLKSDLISENKAKVVSSNFNSVVSLVRMTTKDEDAKTILENTRVSSDGKSVIIKTALSKSVGQEMIQRALNEEAERKAKIKAGK